VYAVYGDRLPRQALSRGEEVMREMPEEKILEIVNRDIALVEEKLKKFDAMMDRTRMFMSPFEMRELQALEHDYSMLVLQRLEDEVDLDPRYRDGEWMVTNTLLDLIRKGLGVKP
jgi:hypothetical protein